MPTSNISQPRLSLTWTAHYHGPNPLAEASLVVAELTADSLPDVGKLDLASANLWEQSCMHKETVGVHTNRRTDDALLALADRASQWALAALNEVRGDVLHAGAIRVGDVVRLWVGFHHPKVSRVALAADLNAPRSSNMVRSRYLRPIAMDDVLVRHLATQSLALEDVPARGQRVTLRSNANLSTGGMCNEATAACHPQVRAMAEQLAKTAGLAAVGINYLTTDISRAPSETGGAFIEMNTTNGLDFCIAAGCSPSTIAQKILGGSLAKRDGRCL